MSIGLKKFQLRVLFTARKRLLDTSKAKQMIGDLLIEEGIAGLEEKAAINLFHTTSAIKVWKVSTEIYLD